MRKQGLLGILGLALVSAPLAISCGVQVHPQGEEPSPPDGTGGATLSGSGGMIGGGSGGMSTPTGTGGSSPMGTGGMSGDAGMTGSGGSMPTGSGGAPVSGMVINIGGTDVPIEKAVAFIHFGHSNMAGRGETPSSLRPYYFTDVDPHAWMYHTTGNQMGFKPAKEPFTAGDSTSLSSNPPTGGPGLPIVKEASKLAPGTTFISLGFGQNAAYCRNYLPGSTFYKAAMSGAMALKGKVTFGGIFIMLGITERHGTAQDIQNYPNCINTIVTQIRTDLGMPNLPLMLTDYEMTANNSRGEDLRPTGPYGVQIIPRIHAVPETVTNSVLVETDGLNLVDDHHFQLDAHQIWVQRALKHMQEKGWFPWK